MDNYIATGASPDCMLGSPLSPSVKERGDVLLSLFENRRVPRFVCAPDGYGKTTLCVQYAHLNYSGAESVFVSSSDARFLRDLDSEALLPYLCKLPGLKMVLFDNVYLLNEDRARLFYSLIDSLCGRGVEVVANGSCPGLAKEYPGKHVAVYAKDLLISDEEARAFKEESVRDVLLGRMSRSVVGRIPVVFFDPEKGSKRLAANLRKERPVSVACAVSQAALVLQRGSNASLERLFGPDIPVRCLETLYPHAGISREGSSFSQSFLSDDERLTLLEERIDDLVSYSVFSTEEEFLSEVLRMCFEEDQTPFAMRMVDALGSAGLKEAFVHRAGPWSRLAFDPSVPITLLSLEGGNDKANLIPQLRLFGTFDLRCNGRRIPVTGKVRKMGRLLLTLLAVNHDRDMARAWVEAALWPESDGGHARASFYNLWSYLKRLFETENPEGDSFLRKSQDVVTFASANVECDVIAVERICDRIAFEKCSKTDILFSLRRLEGLYAGPLLPGESNAKVAAYRDAFLNRVLNAFAKGSNQLFDEGDASSALHFISYAFGLDHTREDVCYLTMMFQYKLGQNVAAMNTRNMCRASLIRRYGIEGSNRIDELYRKILEETLAEEDQQG